MIPIRQKEHLVRLYITSFAAAISDARLFCWLLVTVTALKLKNVNRSALVSHSYQQGRGTSFPRYLSCKLFHHSDDDSCRQKKNCTPWQSKPSKRWTILCMSKSEQTLSTALSKALPRNEVRQSPSRASLAANGLILSSAKDLREKE